MFLMSGKGQENAIFFRKIRENHQKSVKSPENTKFSFKIQ